MQDKVMELIEEFEARLKSLKEEYNNEFECGDLYFYIIDGCYVGQKNWYKEYVDKRRYEYGNAFKTREEAEFEAEKRRALYELKQLGRGFRPNESNYYICLHHDSPDNQKKLFYKSMTEVEHVYGDYYFDSIPKAKDAVYRIGEERILKYLFRVEEE